jgi:hypothetical protein
MEPCHSAELRQQLLLAIAILRRPGATEYLLETVASESEPTAITALLDVRIHTADPRLRERIEGLVQEWGSPKLQSCFDRDFRPGES